MAKKPVQDSSASTSEETSQPTEEVGQTLSRGIKLVAEAAVPGSSLLIDGKVAEGGLHAVAGIAARLLMGPPGWLLVAANSYTRSVTGDHLHVHLGKRLKKSEAPAAATAETVGPAAS